jgi:hypothetical protein
MTRLHTNLISVLSKSIPAFCALGLFLFTQQTNAESIAYEPFGYVHSTLLSNAPEGGGGWSRSWAASLGGGLRVETGRATNAGSNAGSRRNLANPFSLASGTYYFSFIARSDADGRFNFNLQETSLIRWAFSRNADGSFAIQAGLATATSAPGLFAPNREYLVVSKFQGSGSIASVKLFDTSAPEDYTTEPADWDLVASGTTGVTINRLDLRVLDGSVTIDEVRIGTTYSDVVSELRKTFVFAVDQASTTEALNWTHTVREDGDYQIGLAWIETLTGGDVAVEIFHNAMRVKAFYAPPGEVTRFETRLENLEAGDEITIRTTPENAGYRLAYQIALGTPSFAGLPVYDVADFGVVGDGVTDDMGPIQAAVTAARLAGGGVVRFDGNKTYRAVGRTDVVPRSVFDLVGATDISIQGNGARILLHPPVGLADINHAENVRIDGFTVDYFPKPYYQGEITAIDVDKLTIDITVPERYPIPLTGNAPTHHNQSFFGRSFIPDAPGARSGSGDNIYVESVFQRGGARELRIQVPETANNAQMRPRVRNAANQGATEFVVPHMLYGHYQGQTRVHHSARVALSNIHQACAAHFWLGIRHNTGPITLTNVNLKMTEPETELLASWRDGMHIKNGRWGILVEDGDWDGAAMYDDLFAIYSRTQKLIGVEGNVTTLTPSSEGREIFLWQPGDWASFWSPNQGTLRGMARVISAVNVAAPNYEVTFESLPGGIQPEDIVIHEESLNRGTVIRNSRTTNIGTKQATTRFRGTDVLFQDNHFEDFVFRIEYNVSFAAPRTRNVVIEDCYLRAEEGRIVVGRTLGTTFRGGTIDDTDVFAHAGAQNLLFEGVAFENMSGRILELVESSSAWVFGNTSRNGNITGLSDWVSVGENSTVSFSAPSFYPPAIPPSDGTDTVAPEAPVGLVATAPASWVRLDWKRNREPDIHAYNVYRSDSPTGPFRLVAAGLLASRWVDQDVSTDESYHYVVTSLDNSGNESGFSGAVAVTASPPVDLLFEDFTYPDGTALEGGVARGGFGWIGGWEALGSGGLAVSDSRLSRVGITTRAIQNTFVLNPPDTYMSFLARSDADGAFAVDLKQTSGNSIRWAFARNADGSITVRGGNPTATSAPGVFAADTEYLVLSRFDTSTDIAYFKLIETLAPGDFAEEPTDWHISASGLTGVTIDRMDIHITEGTVTLDNLRIGRTYESIALPPPGYAAWAASHGLTGGPFDDDNGNGRSNLMEYALGGNPIDPAEAGFSPVTDIVEEAASRWLYYTYPKRSGPDSGLSYFATTSRTLQPGSWTNDGVELVEITPNGFGKDFDAITVRIPVTGETRAFIRLNVELL